MVELVVGMDLLWTEPDGVIAGMDLEQLAMLRIALVGVARTVLFLVVEQTALVDMLVDPPDLAVVPVVIAEMDLFLVVEKSRKEVLVGKHRELAAGTAKMNLALVLGAVVVVFETQEEDLGIAERNLDLVVVVAGPLHLEQHLEGVVIAPVVVVVVAGMDQQEEHAGVPMEHRLDGKHLELVVVVVVTVVADGMDWKLVVVVVEVVVVAMTTTRLVVLAVVGRDLELATVWTRLVVVVVVVRTVPPHREPGVGAIVLVAIQGMVPPHREPGVGAMERVALSQLHRELVVVVLLL